MNISKQQSYSLMKTQFSEVNLNINSQENSWMIRMLDRLLIQRLLQINLSSKSLTQSKKISPAAMRKEIEQK